MFVVNLEVHHCQVVRYEFDTKEEVLEFMDEKNTLGWVENEDMFLSVSITREELELYY